MENFYVILSDKNGNIDWRHPNEINGSSKKEIYQLIAQNVPEQNIIDILTFDEYENKYLNNGEINNAKANISAISSEQFESGKDFFNAMLIAGNDIGQKNNISKKDEKSNQKKNIKKNYTENTIETDNIEVKYFEEGGIKFKLENGKLYKKVWKQILLNGQKTPDGDEAVSEFRLVSASTKKLISVEKVELQHLDWEEVKTH